MCFSRKSRWREGEEDWEVRKDPVWDLFHRERREEQPQPIAERDRAEWEREKEREQVSAGIGA